MVRAENLTGKDVIGAAGINIGEVKGVELNTSSWKATNLVVKLSSQAADDLGFKKRFRSSTVCMPVSLVKAVGDVITIERSLDELSKNPEISECPT